MTTDSKIKFIKLAGPEEGLSALFTGYGHYFTVPAQMLPPAIESLKKREDHIFTVTEYEKALQLVKEMQSYIALDSMELNEKTSFTFPPPKHNI